MRKKQARYGLKWPDKMPVWQIEQNCIRWGGVAAGSKGTGKLFPHYLALQKALWPHHHYHRWSDLQLKEFLTNKITCVLGPKSSGKTHQGAKWGLCEYLCFPDQTTVLCSSTTVSALELRIWGEIKKLWGEAKLVMGEWLPGHLIDHKHALATDDIKEDDVRDMRCGILGIACKSGGRDQGIANYLGIKNARVILLADECFPAGTLVDTPNGPQSIETISPGDHVTNCLGKSRVLATRKGFSQKMVRIHFVDGRRPIDCTPNHPFLTTRGGVAAVDITPDTEIVSTHEAMSRMQCYRGQQSEVLFTKVSDGIVEEEMCALSNSVHSIRTEGDILLSALLGQMEHGEASHYREDKSVERLSGDRNEGQRLPYGKSSGATKAVCANAKVEQANNCATTEDGRTAVRWMGDWASNQSKREDIPEFIPECQTQPAHSHWRQFKDVSKTSVVPNRFRLPTHQVSGRNRRVVSLPACSESERFGPGPIFERARVDRVEILELSSKQTPEGCEIGSVVYNLQVEGNHTYSVNGLAVFNCQFMAPGFLESISNLDSNQYFKAGLFGNPVDPHDQLGKAAEPVNGWTSLSEPSETAVWQIRFQNSKAINLVGTDSPNFDPPETDKPRYPELVHAGMIENVVSFWGKDSHQYYSQCKGVMKTGLLARRIITREMCETHGAFGQAEWEGTQRRVIAAVDIAYGGVGGDRCVYMEGEFGKSLGGAVLLSLRQWELVPVSVAVENVSPEDQIARWLKLKLAGSGIHPIDCFYDSTGRGSIGSSFAKEFGYVTPVPVEFGGSASKRPVRHDLYVTEEGRKRHKRCDEHYRKFVTELWFSVRYAIEAKQIRGMSLDVAQEGAMREWKEVAGSKLEVETKDETRDRMGRSPDLFDCLATVVEGARQRGFQIQRLGADVHVEGQDNSWLAELAKKHQKLTKSKMLVYS